MAAPLKPAESRLGDAIFAELLRIKREGGKAKWLTRPAVVDRLLLGMPPHRDVPGIYLHLSDWRETDQWIGKGVHGAKAIFDVILVSATLPDMTREQEYLARDVRHALTEGEDRIENALNEGGDGGSVVVQHVGYTYRSEISERVGMAVGTYSVQVSYVWKHEGDAEALALAEALEDDDVRHPFRFPMPTASGRIITAYPQSPLVGPLTNGASQIIFASPPGTHGIVRNMGIITNATNGGVGVPPLLTFYIKYDGESVPSVSIPLLDLCSMYHSPQALTDILATNDIFEICTSPNQSAFPGVYKDIAFNLRLPIPFTNGIEIGVVAPSGPAIHTLFANTLYQDELPECWNRNLRLLAAQSNESMAAAISPGPDWKLESATSGVMVTGTFPANIVGRVINVTSMANTDYVVLARPDSTHVTLDPRETVGALINVQEQLQHGAMHTFLNVPAGVAGYIAALHGSHFGDDTFFEGNVRFYLDGEASPSLRWTSVEDMMHGSFYFYHPNQSNEGGIICHDINTGHASYYKNFFNEPVRFRNGIQGKVPHAYPNGGNQLHWMTLYYREI